jgi:predicted DNA-binding protein (UPF0278 family)
MNSGKDALIGITSWAKRLGIKMTEQHRLPANLFVERVKSRSELNRELIQAR